jgi:hypothetical protein
MKNQISVSHYCNSQGKLAEEPEQQNAERSVVFLFCGLATSSPGSEINRADLMRHLECLKIKNDKNYILITVQLVIIIKKLALSTCWARINSR